MPDPSRLHPAPSESPWSSHAEVSASEFYEDMCRDRRQIVALLRSDLFRLDEDQSDAAGGPYDCVVSWRYVAPARAFAVTLWYGERHLCATIVAKDGRLVGATTHADLDWIDEVLP